MKEKIEGMILKTIINERENRGNDIKKNNSSKSK